MVWQIQLFFCSKYDDFVPFAKQNKTIFLNFFLRIHIPPFFSGCQVAIFKLEVNGSLVVKAATSLLPQ
jgi:hypothetical protein